MLGKKIFLFCRRIVLGKVYFCGVELGVVETQNIASLHPGIKHKKVWKRMTR